MKGTAVGAWNYECQTPAADGGFFVEIHPKQLLTSKLWRLYALLVIANMLDLVFTYFGLSHGFFQEANPFAQARLYTMWPMAMKAGGLSLLAVGIYAALRTTRRPRQRQLLALGAVLLTVSIYGVVVVLHVVYLLTHMV